MQQSLRLRVIYKHRQEDLNIIDVGLEIYADGTRPFLGITDRNKNAPEWLKKIGRIKGIEFATIKQNGRLVVKIHQGYGLGYDYVDGPIMLQISRILGRMVKLNKKDLKVFG